jgi:hypothetical protein
MVLAITSLDPPGVKPTTIVTVPVGKAWAQAPEELAMAVAINHAVIKAFFLFPNAKSKLNMVVSCSVLEVVPCARHFIPSLAIHIWSMIQFISELNSTNTHERPELAKSLCAGCAVLKL